MIKGDFMINFSRFKEALEVAEEGYKNIRKDQKMKDYNVPLFKIPLQEMNRTPLMVLVF